MANYGKFTVLTFGIWMSMAACWLQSQDTSLLPGTSSPVISPTINRAPISTVPLIQQTHYNKPLPNTSLIVKHRQVLDEQAVALAAAKRKKQFMQEAVNHAQYTPKFLPPPPGFKPPSTPTSRPVPRSTYTPPAHQTEIVDLRQRRRPTAQSQRIRQAPPAPVTSAPSPPKLPPSTPKPETGTETPLFTTISRVPPSRGFKLGKIGRLFKKQNPNRFEPGEPSNSLFPESTNAPVTTTTAPLNLPEASERKTDEVFNSRNQKDRSGAPARRSSNFGDSDVFGNTNPLGEPHLYNRGR